MMPPLPQFCRRSVQGGSDPALQMLYQRYLHVVWRYVYVRARRDENVVEDIVSDTFLAAIRGLRDLDPEGGSVCGWLMGIARHKLADHWRQARRNRYDSPMPGTQQAGVSDRAVSPNCSLEAAEQKEQIAEAVAALPDEQRLVLEWKYVDGLSVRAIAGRVGRSEKAVEAVLYRARKSFRAAFDGLQSAAD